MGKQRAPARRLPSEIGAKRFSVDRNQCQIIAASEPLCGRFGRLFGRGKMDVPVGAIDVRAPEHTRRLGGAPFLGSDNFKH
jgi:hypothetical protein